MKKVGFGVFVFVGITGIANAQSTVTIYGVLDASVARLANGSATKTAMIDGAAVPSMWGLKGSEDLGGGMQALFQLESKVNVDTGAGGAAILSGASNMGQGFFSRQAWVGLKGNWGQLSLGRGTTSAIYAGFFAYANPVGINMGTGQVLAVNGVGWDFWNSNQIKYESPIFNGFRVSVSYVPGESAQNSTRGTNYGGNLTYQNSDLTLSASYQKDNDVNSDASLHWSMFVGKYSFGNWHVHAFWNQVNNDNNAIKGWYDSKLWSLGAGYKFTPEFELAGQYFRLKDTIGDTSSGQFGLTGAYLFSKRTSIYGYAIRTNNKSIALQPIYTIPGVANSNATGVGIGMVHRF